MRQKLSRATMKMSTSKGRKEAETKMKSKALKGFIEAAETLANPAIRSWREQGGIEGDMTLLLQLEDMISKFSQP